MNFSASAGLALGYAKAVPAENPQEALQGGMGIADEGLLAAFTERA